MSISWVLLTQGDRQPELSAAIDSIRAQDVPPVEIVVVVNGPGETEPMQGVRVIRLNENVGIPEGRNIGARTCSGGIVAFLDDDARLAGPTIDRELIAAFADDPDLAIVSLHIVDEETRTTQRRHMPSLRRRDPDDIYETTAFLGGACALRRSMFERLGGLPGRFFYALEETDYAWRCLDAGGKALYRGDLVVYHPLTTPGRHGTFVQRTARNRVWLARRRLPWVLAPVYVLVWTSITLARCRGDLAVVRSHFAGLREGLTEPAGERDPVGWTTVARMTRLGRPPVV